MDEHADQPAPASQPVLVAVVDGPGQAERALAEGADLIDARQAGRAGRAAIRERWPGRLWTGAPPGAADADAAVTPAGDAAAAVAVAAISTWLGAPAIRTRHVRAVRRAIDMTASIRGSRPPAQATRGLG